MASPQVMLEKSEESVVHFLQFTRVSYKKEPILFFEGDDDEKYYLSRIESLVNKSFESISCKGKKSVLGVREIIKNHPDYYSSYNLYFIDSDFDNNGSYVNSNDIYITPSYAIENFYVSNSCFNLLMRSEFKCKESRDRDEYVFILEHFCRSKNRFLDVISEFNCFVHAYRNNVEDISSKSGKLNLKGLDQNKEFLIMNFNKDDRSLDFDIDFDLRSVENTFHNIGQDDIKKSLDKLPISRQSLFLDREKFFRGKNLLWFMVKYLNFLKQDCNSKDPVLFKEQRNCTLEFSLKTAIGVLSQYADTPQCLKEFISKNLT